MEAVEEPPLVNSPVESIKVPGLLDEKDEKLVTSVATDVCHKSNGVAADTSESAEIAPVETNIVPIEDGKSQSASTNIVENELIVVQEPALSSEPRTESIDVDENINDEPSQTSADVPSVTAIMVDVDPGEKVQDIPINTQELDIPGPLVELYNSVDPATEKVTFETEILVEAHDTEIIETVTEESVIDEHDTSNLLSDLGQSIELSEALRSSDVTDNVENNNCTARQEMFNKEELLDILEGNDVDQSANIVTTKLQNMRSDKFLEAQLALRQLSRLKGKKTKSRNVERLSRSRKSDIKPIKKEQPELSADPSKEQDIPETGAIINEENIVSDLVKEWDDEDLTEVEKSTKLLENSEKLIESTDELVKTQETVTNDGGDLARTSIDAASEGKSLSLNKSHEDGQPQRRLGRVIKKKVIFDPDNPDTFTKSKNVIKSKESSQVIQEKDQPSVKKIKTEPTIQRSKSKSPVSKMQWKKPSPKTCKQNKRLTEVDKLLMDEGAVNMIYQLTSEAPKGKKNMKTKAEFIKKLQSSTPDSKEMKFRERKKECKYEEGEARKILGTKHRPSLNSSVKSPSVSEDFEAHSADDSIIYRRHSSSSYSSSCMSPRRLSDVDTNGQSVTRNHQQSADQSSNEGNSTRSIDVFMSDSIDQISTNTINKDDCLSIKEKLNSKLNLALNKRKRDNSKADKPMKLKKVKSDEKTSGIASTSSGNFKYLSINLTHRLAEICIQKQATNCNIEMVKELDKALKMIDLRNDTSVTLLSSECGTTYSNLDLTPLLDNNMENMTNFAHELAESIRSLLHTMEQHGKLLCSGASSRCSGIGLAFIGLSDVALASERASFSISAKSNTRKAPIAPGVSVLTAYRDLPQPLLNSLVVFGNQISASEALQGGIVSRVLWPENFDEQVQIIAKDLASQPAQNIWLKKQLLSLKKGSDTFLSHLEKERDLLVEYWTSVEGQEILRATYDA